MTQEQVNEINFKDKCELIRALLKHYKNAKIILSNSKITLTPEDNKSLEIYALIHSILNVMKDEQKNIILTSFFNDKTTTSLERKDSTIEYKIQKLLAINKFSFYLLA